MRRPAGTALAPEAERLLVALASSAQTAPSMRVRCAAPDAEAALLRADLATRGQKGALAITAAGQAWLARQASNDRPSHVDPFTAQHLDLHQRHLNGPEGRLDVTINDLESPLAWLARRKGKDGHPLIEPTQLQAGERLRSQFTRAQLTPRVTSNWEAPIAQGSRSAGSDRPAQFTEAIVSARRQVRDALNAVGPEFAGLLLDVCCFLTRLEDIERKRGWPARSAKVVLQLALNQLARHYGLGTEARGRNRASLRVWVASDAALAIDETGELLGA